MYNSILEYIVNADMYYRLWMAAQMQYPHSVPSNIVQCRKNWMPGLVGVFDDVRDVPSLIRCNDVTHIINSDVQFHTGNKNPSIDAKKLEIFWGLDEDEVFSDQSVLGGHMRTYPIRKTGPAKITLSGLKMWHHEDTLNRRRGDAIICEQITFEWNTKKHSSGAFRENGPYQIIIKKFRAAYNMGMATDASYAHLGVSWGTENGVRLGEQKVESIINQNNIGVNYLLVDSSFADGGEEFIFWDEIGRAQFNVAP
jgi:hypothetical protein